MSDEHGKSKPYKYEGLLSMAYRGLDCYCRCNRCCTVWLDDALAAGAILCPNCGDIALERGLTIKETGLME